MIRGLASAVRRRLLPDHVRSFAVVKPLLAGKSGLEVGGPSPMFARGERLPLYDVIGRLDNVNFSAQTVWEGTVTEGATFQFDRDHAPGRQFIGEATDLGQVAANAYDAVFASHTLEHTANPLKALREWLRTLRAGGILVLVVPHKDGTFDHRRPVTTLRHLVDDEARGTTEDDLTHLPEILSLHDLAMDPRAGDAATFKARSERNAENRCLHHHVCDTHLAVAVVNHVGLQVLAVEPVLPHDIIVIAREPVAGAAVDNEQFLGSAPPYRATSPFALDRA